MIMYSGLAYVQAHATHTQMPTHTYTAVDRVCLLSSLKRITSLVSRAACLVSCVSARDAVNREKASGFSLTLQLCAVARFCGSWLTAVPFQFSSVSRQFTTSKQLTVKTVCQQSDCRRLSFLSALCLFSQLPCAVCHLYECSTSVSAAVLFKPQI